MEEIKLPTVVSDSPIEPKKVYPLVEEMTFKAPVKSEEEGYRLLMAIQVLVNELGSEQILSTYDYLIKNPSMIQKAKKYLPYIKMLT